MVNTKSDFTTLLILVKEQRWEQVISRCKAGTDEREILARDSSFFNRTCLQLACARKPPVGVIRILLSYGSGSRVTGWKEDSLWYIPLHTACRYHASAAVISLLLDTYKQGVKVKDKHGWTPLHVASYFNPKLSLIQILIKSDKLAIGTMEKTMTMKNDRSTPLLLACPIKAHSNVIKALLDHNPQAATEVDGSGQWALLHLAIWHDAPISTLKALLLWKQCRGRSL